jgi:hypothetical protein
VKSPQAIPLAISIPSHAGDMAQLQSEAETEVAGLDAHPLTVANDAEAADVLEFMRGWLQRKDAAEAMRKRATAPLTKAKAEIDGWFKPALTAVAKIETACRGALNAYETAKAAAALDSRAKAQAAAASHDTGAMLAELIAAADNAPVSASVEGVAVPMRWIVKRIVADLLPREWLIPDEKRINAHARACKADAEPEPIPGVVFERVAEVRVSR